MTRICIEEEEEDGSGGKETKTEGKGGGGKGKGESATNMSMYSQWLSLNDMTTGQLFYYDLHLFQYF